MIIIKSQKETEAMREGGKILAEIMRKLGEIVLPGNNTEEINKLARKLVFDNGGVPVFEGYGDPKNPYPAAVCVSINNEIVHGVPRKDRIIREGDIVKLDIGMKYKNLITDMARTFPAGEISIEAQKLLNATRESLNEGIKKIKAGAKLSDYSQTVERYIRLQGFSVVQELVGHGVGKKLHEDPQIPNYDMHKREIILQEGMTLALEPMINAGTRYIKLLKDGWTYATKDGKLSAHFEDTVLVAKDGAEILTRI
ncbi:MAG TPA: type I methionyl aminopeptidase [Candidatus Moranbacteria bacterium]|nr:type I methionyl aminopeptidase [Candidatus Moranbacteria bacterium]HAT74735.1 type I methionyl aminopeptidase [Candidatus Moranbacteria bacterium]